MSRFRARYVGNGHGVEWGTDDFAFASTEPNGWVDRDTAAEFVQRLTMDLPPTPDPEAPPIACVEVDPIDGQRVWEATGREVRKLGDEWQRSWPWLGSDVWMEGPHGNAFAYRAYKVRRKPELRTVMVELPADVAHTLANRALDWLGQDTGIAVNSACRKALAEDGDQ